MMAVTPRLKLKKTGRWTDGGGSGLKFSPQLKLTLIIIIIIVVVIFFVSCEAGTRNL